MGIMATPILKRPHRGVYIVISAIKLGQVRSQQKHLPAEETSGSIVGSLQENLYQARFHSALGIVAHGRNYLLIGPFFKVSF
jgi:hypothetical protein